MTEKQQIVNRISELEKIVSDSNAEIERLTTKLKETPDALLERDPEAAVKAAAETMNDYLRRDGLLPPKQ